MFEIILHQINTDITDWKFIVEHSVVSGIDKFNAVKKEQSVCFLFQGSDNGCIIIYQNCDNYVWCSSAYEYADVNFYNDMLDYIKSGLQCGL